MTSACTYHGALRPASLADPTATSRNDEPRIAVSNRVDGIREIEFTVYAVTFNYETKEAFLAAATATVESASDSVSAEVVSHAQSRRVAVPYLQANMLSSTPTSAVIEVESRIDLVDVPTEGVLRTYRSTEQAHYSNPPSASALGFLTGLSLFVLAPITLPIAIQIEGNHGRDELESAIRDSLSSIRTSLARDLKREDEAARIDACVRSAANDPNLASLAGDVSLDAVETQTFDMLASTSRPTDEERVAIKHWSELISSCYIEQEAFMLRWAVPASLRALSGATKTASQKLRVLLFSGAITYGEYAQRRQEIHDSFEVATAKIEAELAEQSAASAARAELLAMEAQKVNLAAIEARQAQAQTILLSIQTMNQANAIAQQRQQLQLQRQLIQKLDRPRVTSCNLNRYNASCTSW